MSEIVESFKTPGGQELQKIQYKDANDNTQTRWRTKSNNEFRTEAQVDQIKQNAAKRSVETNNPQNNIDYVVEPTDETDRRNALKIEYPYYDSTDGIDPNRPDPNGSFDNRVRGWMGNETLRKQVKQDPLIRTQKEADKALEAKARQVANDLQSVKSEREAMEILKRYDIY